MATSIDTNPYPLPPCYPSPGVPVNLADIIPDLDCPYVNMIKVQSWPGNYGMVFFGNKRLNVTTREGIEHVLSGPGDVLMLGSIAQNVYRLSDFMVDVEMPGDCVLVSIYVR